MNLSFPPALPCSAGSCSPCSCGGSSWHSAHTASASISPCSTPSSSPPASLLSSASGSPLSRFASVEHTTRRTEQCSVLLLPAIQLLSRNPQLLNHPPIHN